MSSSMMLVVGLGNPGEKYEATRHNAGFWFLDEFARELGVTFRKDAKFSGQVAQGEFASEKLLLLKPDTYMNASGQSVSACAKYYKIERAQILVVHDEIDLPPGAVKLKSSGGHGGHNGLRDIIKAMGGNGFWRLRLGVGHPGNKDDVVDYVLHSPSKGERSQIDGAMVEAMDVMRDFIAGEHERAMHQLHTK